MVEGKFEFIEFIKFNLFFLNFDEILLSSNDFCILFISLFFSIESFLYNIIGFLGFFERDKVLFIFLK